MPLTWGGRIRTVDDMRERISRGADKITINSQAVRTPPSSRTARGCSVARPSSSASTCGGTKMAGPKFISTAAATPTGLGPGCLGEAACEKAGAGEILLQVDTARWRGRGLRLRVDPSASASALTIPLIACSGVGRFEHYAPGIEAGASAVAAANLWHFKGTLADRLGKKALGKGGGSSGRDEGALRIL